MSDLLHIVEANKIESQIRNNVFGRSGDRFPTVRELAEQRRIALVTAQKTVVELRRRGFLELKGKKCYITYGRIKKETELGRIKAESNIIGLHVTNLKSSFIAELARAVEVSAKKQGYYLVIASSAYNYEEEKQILKMFCDIGAAGVISCPGTNSKTKSLYESLAIPYVFLGRTIEKLEASAVLVNNFPISKRIAAHFVELGFKSFLYIGLKELDIHDDPRYSGFKEGIIKNGFSFTKENLVQVGYDELSRIENMVGAILLRKKEPTAIFCFHDLIAVEVIKACHKYNIDIPSQAAVAGFDNLSIAKSCIPNLTTAGYRINEMAETSVKLIINKINNENDCNTNYYLDPYLIARGSTVNCTENKETKPGINDLLYKAYK